MPAASNAAGSAEWPRASADPATRCRGRSVRGLAVSPDTSPLRARWCARVSSHARAPVRIEVGDLPRHLGEELLCHCIRSRGVAKDTADVDTHEATDATLECDERGVVAARDGEQQVIDEVRGSVFDDDGPRGLLVGRLRRYDPDTRGAQGATDVGLVVTHHRGGGRALFEEKHVCSGSGRHQRGVPCRGPKHERCGSLFSRDATSWPTRRQRHVWECRLARATHGAAPATQGRAAFVSRLVAVTLPSMTARARS